MVSAVLFDADGVIQRPSLDWSARLTSLVPSDGEAFVAAAVVEVPVVPPCCLQETTNAMPIKAVIKDKTIFFIVCG